MNVYYLTKEMSKVHDNKKTSRSSNIEPDFIHKGQLNN